MRLKPGYLLLALALSASVLLKAQRHFEPERADPITESWRFSHIEELDGMGVRTVLIDENNHYWFGINRGVLHYDGNSFTAVGPEEGPEEQVVYQLANTPDGIMAILERSIYLRSEKSWSKFMDIPTYTSGRKFKVAQSSKEQVMLTFSHGFMTNFRGVWHVYTPSTYFDRYDSIESIVLHDLPIEAEGDFTDVLRLSASEFWIAVNKNSHTGDIVRFRMDENGTIEPGSVESLSTIYGLRFGEGQNLMRASNGDIWIVNSSTDIGVHHLSGDRWNHYSFNKLFGEDEYMNSITQTRDGRVRIGGLGNLYSFDGNKWLQLFAPEHEVPTSQILVRNAGNFNELWVVGLQSKVYCIDLSATRWTTYQDLNFEDEDRLGNQWFLHKDGRVVIHSNGEWTSLGAEEGILDTPVRIFITSEDQVWIIGSHRGTAATSYFDGTKWITDRHPAVSWGFDYRSVLEAADGSLWFGAGVDHISSLGQHGGVLQLKDPTASTKTWIHHIPGTNGLEQSNVYGIAQSDDGKIWIGGTRLCFFDGEQWHRADNKLLDNFVNTVTSDADGTLWAGSRYYGLYTYKNSTWSNFNTNNGLVSNTISDILPVENGLYLATDKDISYFDGKSWTNNIFPEKMLVRNERGSLKRSHDGDIWINKSKREWKRRALVQPTPQAFKTFFTSRYNNNEKAPETWIEVYDNEIDDSGNTLIKWGGRDYLYETGSRDLHFAYRINGQDWSAFTKETHLALTGLQDGAYIFEVKSRDLDLNEDLTPASVEFIVLPPVWKQQWFIFMVSAFLIIIVVFEVRIINKKNKLAAVNRSLETHQKELQHNNALLEERNLEISNQRDRLQHLIKKNESLSKTKIQFFTNITHEFRTPLALIYGPVKQLFHHAANEKDRELLTIATKNISRLQKLINQLLEFRNVQTSSLGLFLGKADIVDFVKQISSIFNNLAAQREVDFHFYSEIESHKVYFDQDKLEKIIYNILSNAFKYSPTQSSITVSVKLLSNSHVVIIEVADTGFGMTENELAAVFNQAGRKHHQEDSMGIGLPYTRELVEKHLGTIDIMSQKGKGTKVTLRIPGNLDETQNDIPHPVAEKHDQPIPTAINGKKEENFKALLKNRVSPLAEDSQTLLIVEDNKDMRDFLYNLLADKYRLMQADDGQQAIDIMKDEDVDLIVTDVMMPRVDGFTLCESIKQNLETSHIPVILLSARDESDDLIEGYQHGADDYIVKPFDPSTLIFKIQNMLRSRQALKNRYNEHFILNPKEVKLESADEKLLRRLTELMEENLSDSSFDVNSMCESIHMSHMQFIRKVKQLTGKKPIEILKAYRLKKARQLLVQNKVKISEVAYMVGYDLPGSFARVFKQEFGETPTEFVKGRRDERYFLSSE